MIAEPVHGLARRARDGVDQDRTHETTVEVVLGTYPSAKVGLLQSYHIGGDESCGYQSAQTHEEVRRNNNSHDGLDNIASVIRASAEVFASLLMSLGDLATTLRDDEQLALACCSSNDRRSLDKASYLRAYGLPRARSLTGGFAAWAAEVGHEVLMDAAQG